MFYIINVNYTKGLRPYYMMMFYIINVNYTKGAQPLLYDVVLYN